MLEEVLKRYEPVIGLEVHAQLLTRSKAFAPVSTEFGVEPNINVSPLCIALPGTLPALNENVVLYSIKMGLATHCEIAERSIFARKNYFYPDLPKGYQISQYATPICANGHIDIELADGSSKRIGITRIHMEEDAGKSIHDQDPFNSLIDLNRAGVPLIEIVSEPDIRSAQEAYAYLTKIKQIVEYLEICDGNMEEGSLRCDANISIRPIGREKFGTRAEIKNLNSFRNVERAIEYEIVRQAQILDQGGEIVQETRLWDSGKFVTRQMRSKEEAHDYRYFPEPDLPPVVVTSEMMAKVTAELPELPDVRKERFIKEMGLTDFDAATLTDSRYLADYFEEVLQTVDQPKMVANFIITEVRRVLNELSIDIRDFTIKPKRLAGLVALRVDGKISSSAQQTIFNAMLSDQESAEFHAEKLDLIQNSDTSTIEPIVEEVLANFSEKVAEYKSGKKGLIGLFIGEVMKKSGGKANPQLVREAIIARIG